MFFLPSFFFCYLLVFSYFCLSWLFHSCFSFFLPCLSFHILSWSKTFWTFKALGVGVSFSFIHYFLYIPYAFAFFSVTCSNHVFFSVFHVFGFFPFLPCQFSCLFSNEIGWWQTCYSIVVVAVYLHDAFCYFCSIHVRFDSFLLLFRA